MLTVEIPAQEFYDAQRKEFIPIHGETITVEHSLLSISKWESKWHKPFIGKKHTLEELRDYVRCMTITPNVSPLIYLGLTAENWQTIRNYMEDPMTATTITDRRTQRPSKTATTAEVIYQAMVSLGIPFECQKWHINRLLTLIRVCEIRGAGGQKMTPREQAALYSSLNSSRRSKHGSKG